MCIVSRLSSLWSLVMCIVSRHIVMCIVSRLASLCCLVSLVSLVSRLSRLLYLSSCERTVSLACRSSKWIGRDHISYLLR